VLFRFKFYLYLYNMKANELRIGNKINYEGFVATVIGLTTDDSVRVRYNKSELQIIECTAIFGWERNVVGGIPLTEEWLLKFGFTYRHGGYLHNHKTNYFTLTGDLPDDLDYYGGSGGIGANIKYVHQLQNLYFCITGEELITQN